VGNWLSVVPREYKMQRCCVDTTHQCAAVISVTSRGRPEIVPCLFPNLACAIGMSCPHGLAALNAVVPCRTSGCAAGWGGGCWVHESNSPGFFIVNWPSSPSKQSTSKQYTGKWLGMMQKSLYMKSLAVIHFDTSRGCI
jgi:hypothetical protein